MRTLFTVTDTDRARYERIRDFLPEKIIDVHTHVWLDEFCNHSTPGDARVAAWPLRVARDNSIDDLLETYRLLFPGKQVTPLIFSLVEPGDAIERANAYIQENAHTHKLPTLIFAQPQWTAKELYEKMSAGDFLGVKVYLSHADPAIAKNDITIYDFLPHHQLDVFNAQNKIVMLHIPRDGRLRDPVNLQQMIEIERNYPNIKLIIAHVGRAYCDEDIGNAFEILKDTEKMVFDISANTNSYVFTKLLQAVGAKRVLFGSDLPITRMRMRRICEQGEYINLVPKGLYGDVSEDEHIQELEGPEAESLSFFLYEEIEALQQAAMACKLTPSDVQDVFYNNAVRIIEAAGKIL